MSSNKRPALLFSGAGASRKTAGKGYPFGARNAPPGAGKDHCGWDGATRELIMTPLI